MISTGNTSPERGWPPGSSISASPPAPIPSGPDNILGFVSGLLTGTPSYFTGRWSVVGKSPLTGTWGDANCGGNLSPAIKRNGFDGIFFRGISEKPVYLYVKNGQAELCDASHLWGRDTTDAEAALIREHGAAARVAVIGPAGEKLSLISGVFNDRGRMAARSGLGAVMGAKRLKAVVLDGKLRIPVHDADTMKRLSQSCNKWVQLQPPFLSGKAMAYLGALMRILPTQMALDGMLYKIFLKKWGTTSMNQMSLELGDAPVKNWKGSNVDWGMGKSATVNPDHIKAVEKAKYHCYACPLGCGGICVTKPGAPEVHKPEYESVLSLGGQCMNADLESIFQMNEMLNRAGMDTISAGGADLLRHGVLRAGDPHEGRHGRDRTHLGKLGSHDFACRKDDPAGGHRRCPGRRRTEGGRTDRQGLPRNTRCTRAARNCLSTTDATTLGLPSTTPWNPPPAGTRSAPRCTTRCSSSGRR